MKKKTLVFATALAIAVLVIVSLPKSDLPPFKGNDFWSVSGEKKERGISDLGWDLRDEKILRVWWDDGDHSYRITLQRLGVNNLPNIRAVEHRQKNGDVFGKWKLVNRSDSGWLPPLIVKALENYDKGPRAFTGGSHGSTGAADGRPTAKNTNFQIVVDGAEKDAPGRGKAKDITVYVTNDIAGFNTKESGRLVMRQQFVIEFRDGGIYIDTGNTALENVGVVVDYALQPITTGFKGQRTSYGSEVSTEPYVDADFNTGPKSQNPSVWAASFESAEHGGMMLWMDRGYKDGDVRYVDDRQMLIRGSQYSRWYLGVVLADLSTRPNGFEFKKGDSYGYRAGVVFTPPNEEVSIVNW
ncbi:hypothetical protein [Pseudomonas sp. FGI182]|uniref:hypothetical protein n=1 Tax=Pseudomonas sp. FGI182 TaxID=1259844 RepID=UPI0012DE1AC6|nr:hypothetical protein [Pseudomonas sp. FGI182]